MLDVADVVTRIQDVQPGKLRHQHLLNKGELLLRSSGPDFADLKLEQLPHSWKAGRTGAQMLHCKGKSRWYFSSMMKKQRPSEHIPFPRLLNKHKDDDFLSHMLNHMIMLFLEVLFLFLILAFMAPTQLHNLSYYSLPIFACPAGWTLFPLFLPPHKEITHLFTTYLHHLHPQISKAVICSSWSLPWLACQHTSIAAITDAMAPNTCAIPLVLVIYGPSFPRYVMSTAELISSTRWPFPESRHSMIESCSAQWEGRRVWGQTPGFVDRYLHMNLSHIVYLYVTLARSLISLHFHL